MLKKISKLLGIGLTIALLTSLLAVAAPVAADVSQPQVTLPNASDDDISKVNAQYIIRFNTNKQLSGNATVGDTLTITLPAGYTLAGTVTATLTAGPGWIDTGTGATYQTTINGGNGAFTTIPAAKQIVYTLDTAGTEYIGEGAEIRISITTGITNPAAIGDYTLSVQTSQEMNPVSSNTYSIVAPFVPPLSGVVTVKNPSGVILAQYTGANAISNGIAAAVVPGSVVEVGDGTYAESPTLANGVNEGVTVKATGTGAIVQGTLTVNTNSTALTGNTVIDGLIMQPTIGAPGAPVILIGATANNTDIMNCTLSLNPGKAAASTNALIAIPNPTTTDRAVRVMNCSFDTTGGAFANRAIWVGDGPVTVDGCTFMLDAMEVAPFTDDVAIEVIGTGAAMDVVTVTGSTFTGASGVGIRSADAALNKFVATGNTFDGLSMAAHLNSAAAGLTLTGNTIINGTTAPTSTVDTANAAIYLQNSATGVSIQKNTIQDNNGLSVSVGTSNANVAGITFVGNTLMGNALGVVNKNMGTTLMAELNYWGDASGPTISSNPGGMGDPIVAPGIKYGTVDYNPWANTSTSEVSAGNVLAATGTVDKSTTVGVAFTSLVGVGAPGVTLIKYSGNPAPVEPPAPALAGAFYDVYSPASAAGDTATILFYATGINSDTKAYYYSELQKRWVMCSSQSVAGNSAYVFVTITGLSNPSNLDLGGTVFALIDQKTIPSAPSINTPKIGEANVAIEPMFTWSAVQGAIRYEISVADDPSFTFMVFSHNVEGITFYKADAANEEALDYDTTYYWRVRAILDDSYAASTPATAYTTGIFTTIPEPVEVEEGTVVEVNPTTPEVNVDIPPTQITVEPAGSAIPTYILWIIVVVGAILVIALIVLIVRTRRVA